MPTMYIPTTLGWKYIITCNFGVVDSCFSFVPSSGQDLSPSHGSVLYQLQALSGNKPTYLNLSIRIQLHKRICLSQKCLQSAQCACSYLHTTLLSMQLPLFGTWHIAPQKTWYINLSKEKNVFECASYIAGHKRAHPLLQFSKEFTNSMNTPEPQSLFSGS